MSGHGDHEVRNLALALVEEHVTYRALVVCDLSVLLALYGNLGDKVAVIMSLCGNDEIGELIVFAIKVEVTSATVVVTEHTGINTAWLDNVDPFAILVTERINDNCLAVKLNTACGAVDHVVVRSLVYTIGIYVILNYYGSLCMTESINVGVNVSVTAGAGVSGISLLGAVGRCYGINVYVLRNGVRCA